jgi:5-oxopent-3-ene-1,2,5-tricarboxylate decarboxylase / 2-hydroxyhepta-2,4-diene-1,7-dioate isomerase
MRRARLSVAGTGMIVEAVLGSSGTDMHVGEHPVAANLARFEPAVEGLVYGVILNDTDSLAVLGAALSEPPYKAPPKAPVLYIKPFNTHAGHGAAVHLPAGADRIEVFGALGIVIGSQATRVPEDRALDVVRGYTVVADLSLPQKNFFRPPIREKCFDGSCPIGPWVTDRADVSDPGALEVRITVNGELRQTRSMRNLVRSVPRLIADVTEFMTLYPGDVLLTGIAHIGPPASAGDTIAVEIPGIGRLENRIVRGGGAA